MEHQYLRLPPVTCCTSPLSSCSLCRQGAAVEGRGPTSRILKASAREMSLKSTSSPEAVLAAPAAAQGQPSVSIPGVFRARSA